MTQLDCLSNRRKILVLLLGFFFFDIQSEQDFTFSDSLVDD